MTYNKILYSMLAIITIPYVLHIVSIILRALLYKRWGLRPVLAIIPGIRDYEFYKFISNTAAILFCVAGIMNVLFTIITCFTDNEILTYVWVGLVLFSLGLRIVYREKVQSVLGINNGLLIVPYILIEPIFWILVYVFKYELQINDNEDYDTSIGYIDPIYEEYPDN